MTVRVTKVDPGDSKFTSQVTFTSAVFVATDVLDFYTSLGRSAKTIEIESASDASVTILVNGYNVRYPIDADDAARDGINIPDLSATPYTWTSANAPSYTIANGETLTLTGVPVKNLVISALTVGAGTGISIKAQ